MTSEIVIMTPNAVALAADSAVTIDYKKTYNGINKLFMLSNNPPVGIMFYNNVSFLNIPFETIIKEFRKSITDYYNRNFFKKILNDSNRFNKVSDFQNAFIEYIKLIIPKSDFKISFKNKLDYFIKIVLPTIVNENQFYEKILNFNLPDEEIIHSVYNSLDKNYLNQCKLLAETIANQLKPSEDNSKFINKFIYYYIWEMFAQHYTGIVLAGFDSDKLFPYCSSFKICYLYDDEYILCDFKHDYITTKSDPAIVNMFAQHDVINSFLKSIDPTTKNDILNKFEEINTNHYQNLIESIENNPKIDVDSKNEIITQINNFNNENLKIKFSEMIEKLENEHVTPILHHISVLPYSELSNLCESLIKITSLKRKVGSNLESVGGDVDVAIITKGDGFIWTKRKHYFDANLNYQFFEKKEREKL